jgi:hypothetical protein
MKSTYAIAALLIVTGARADGGDMVDLNARADLVVIGVVSTYVADQQQVSFDVVVERVLRGNILVSSAHVSHKWMSNRARGDQGANGTFRGIWFLSHGAVSDWDVLPAHGNASIRDLFFPAAAAALPPPYQYNASTSAVDALTLEVAGGIESDGTSPELMLGAVTSLNGPVVEIVFSRFLASPSVSFQVIGLSGFLEHNLQDSVPQLLRLWPAISQDPARQYVLSALRDSFRDTTPGTVRQLSALAVDGATSSEVRRAAVVALAAMHTKESLPFLAGLLRSPNPEERMKGVYGLSSFANGCPPQTRGNFKTMQYLQFLNPSPYRTRETMAQFAFRRGPPDQEAALIAFWQQWWDKQVELH